MKPLVFTSEEKYVPNLQVEVDEFINKTNAVVVHYKEDETNYDDLFKSIKRVIKDNGCDYLIGWYVEFLFERIRPLHELGIPFIMHSGDCWSRLFSNKYKQLVEKHKPHSIMVENKCTIPAFRDYIDNDNINYVWAPHSFEPKIMKDYGEEKIYDVTSSGKFSNYDDRRNMHAFLERSRSINYHRLTGRKGFTNTWKDYARGLNKGWISISSMQNSNLLYYKDTFIGNCFSKNYEISACGSCLLVRRFGDAELIGYKDGENCIMFDELREFPNKLRYHLDDKENLRKMIKSGYDLVHSKHTVSEHTRLLVNDINKIL